jgi:hypothetical protein
MKARLGFALASHLDPEIMLIDEVLSVGDIYFQNKCKRRMEELKHKGITMIMVSHSLGAIMQFCDRTIWIEQSRLMADGPTKEVSKQYQGYMHDKSINVSTEDTPGLTATVQTTQPEEFGPHEESTDAQLSFKLFGKLRVPEAIFGRHPDLADILSAQPVLVTAPVSGKEYEGRYMFYNEAEHIEQLTYELFSPAPDGKLYSKQGFSLAVCAKIKRKVHNTSFGACWYNPDNMEKCGVLWPGRASYRLTALEPGWHLWVASVPLIPFSAGHYLIDLGIMDGSFYLYRQPLCHVTVAEPNKTLFFDLNATHLIAGKDTINKYSVISGLYMESGKKWPVHES